MSKNINQIFIANPITSNVSTDLMYFGRSPYGAGNDTAMTYANFAAQFGASYTASALTSSNDTNVTITLGGTPATALLHAASLTMGWAGQLSLARGGSNASLTASNGGIVYSTASAMAILAGTATASLPLLSGSTAAPTWGSFALSLGGALTTAGALTTIGAFGATFNFTNTTNVTFPTSGTLATTSQLGMNVVNLTGSSATLAPNTLYVVNSATPFVNLILPATAAVGDTYKIVGKSSGLWAVVQLAGQTIHYGTSTTTTGAGGNLISTDANDCIEITCTIADTDFAAYGGQGILTVS